MNLVNSLTPQDASDYYEMSYTQVLKDIIGKYILVEIEVQESDFVIIMGHPNQVNLAVQKLLEANIGLTVMEETKEPGCTWLLID